MPLRPAVWTVLAALLTASCGPSGPQWPRRNELVVALENAPIQLDPRLATDQAASRVFQLVLDGLVTKTPRGDLVPALAASWELLDDGRRYRFHLRRDVRFHDGRPLRAADVVWTYGSILDGTVVTPKRASLDSVQRVEAVDPWTVDFVLERPNGALLVNLTSYLGVVPAGSLPETFSRHPIGTGPFRFVGKTPEKVILEPFSGYRSGPPALARVILREVPDATVRALELRKGSVQLAVNNIPPDLVPTFRRDPAYRVVEDPGSNYAYLGINLEDPVLSHLEVRRAIALALDRELLVASLWRGLGTVTETMMPPGHWARNDDLEPIPYDPERAARLLDDAGFPDPDGAGPEPRFELTYKTSTNETSLLQAQAIQAMLGAVGIRIRIRSYEFATFYADIKRGAFQLFSLTWTGVVDPDIYAYVLDSRRIPPRGANRGRYRNPRFDALVEAGLRFATPERRRPYYLEAQEILAHDLPYISLFTRTNVAVMAAPLEGYRNYLSAELYSLKDMRWRTTEGSAAPPASRRPSSAGSRRPAGRSLG